MKDEPDIITDPQFKAKLKGVTICANPGCDEKVAPNGWALCVKHLGESFQEEKTYRDVPLA